jgi:hypothetical protein
VRVIDNDTFDEELAKYGVCDGFVIDTMTGSVRLPKWSYQAPLGEMLPVRGNGTVLGLTDGSINLGIYEKSGDGVNSSENLYGSSIGTTGGTDVVITGGLGVTSDPDKSGIVAETNAPTDHFVLCIQVFNAATALSKQESAQLASQMQMKAQTDLANVNSNIDFIVEHWEDANGNWYDLYRSGKLVQGGFLPTTAESKSYIHNLNKEFANANYQCFLNCSTDTSTERGWAYVFAKTESTFTSVIAGGEIPVSWFAIGKAATE